MKKGFMQKIKRAFVLLLAVTVVSGTFYTQGMTADAHGGGQPPKQEDTSTYTATYYAADGKTVIKTATATIVGEGRDKHAIITLEDGPVITGKEFTGWLVKSGQGSGNNKLAGETVELYNKGTKFIAQYRDLPAITITYNNYDGSLIKAVEAVNGGAVLEAAPAARTLGKYTYTFTGWSDGTNTYAASSTQPFTTDTTLTASYNDAPIKYYILKRGLAQPSETYSYDSNNYYTGVAGGLNEIKLTNVESEVATLVDGKIPALSSFSLGTDAALGTYETVKWYVIKTENDGIHVDGIIVPVTFTVTFVDKDGVQIGEKVVVNGGTGVTAPTAPTVTGLDFTGWSETPERLANVTGDMTVQALYSKTQVTATFINGLTNEQTTITVDYGTTVELPAVPTEKGYVFEWNKTAADLVELKSDIKVTAVPTKLWTVTFKGLNGESVVDTAEVRNGGTLATTAFPTIPNVPGYEIVGWNVTTDLTNITSDIVVLARYNQIGYSVKFMGMNGAVVSEQTVYYQKAATVPTRDDAEAAGMMQDGYHFVDWEATDLVNATNNVNSVVGNMVIMGNYAINEYQVTFVTEVGTEISHTTVEHGANVKTEDIPADTSVPVKEGYHFAGWEGSTINITGPTIIKATTEINEYEVTFVDGNGDTIETIKVNHGSDATAPENVPVPEGTHFTGWDKELTNITEPTTITATTEVNEYEVTFVDGNGDTIETIKVNHGSTATAPENVPVPEGTHFTGWDKELTNITGPTTITATTEVNEYTVTFVDRNGNTLSTQTIKHGSDATAPTAPGIYGFNFSGWSAPYTNVTKDLTVQAQYSAIPSYTVTFVDMNGNTISTSTVMRGTGTTAPTAPTVDGYTFTGWDKAFAYVYEDMTVRALYTENPVVPVAPVVINDGVAPLAAAPVVDEAPAEETPVAIDEEATPLADTIATPNDDTVTIDDEETAQAAGFNKGCWIHWVMLFITILYAAYAIGRANYRAKKIDELEDEAQNAQQHN